MENIASADPLAVIPDRKVSFTREQSALAALIFFMMVMNYLDRQALSVVAPMIRKELGLSITDYANAVNAFLVAYSLMYVGSGLVLDRIGYRLGLALFVALWSIFSALHAAITGFGTLVLFRFLLGLAEPAGFTGAVKAIAEKFGPAQRALATGFLNMGAGLGSLLAPPLLVFLSLRYGWRTAFLVASVAGAIWTPLWLWIARPPARDPKTTERNYSFRDNIRLVRDRRVLAYTLTRFVSDSAGYFVLFWLPEYLVSSKHFTFLMLGSLGWIPLISKDAGALLGGYVSSKLVQSGLPPIFSRKIMMSIAAGFAIAGTLMGSGSAVWLVLFSLSMCTFAVGMWACNLHTICADAFPQPIVARVHGFAGSAGGIGGIVFNSLVGYFSGRQEYSAVLFMFALLLPFGVAPLWLWLRDRSADRPFQEPQIRAVA
jgi:ACS family hexuronate transporter-like MFS transporter